MLLGLALITLSILLLCGLPVGVPLCICAIITGVCGVIKFIITCLTHER